MNENDSQKTSVPENTDFLLRGEEEIFAMSPEALDIELARTWKDTKTPYWDPKHPLHAHYKTYVQRLQKAQKPEEPNLLGLTLEQVKERGGEAIQNTLLDQTRIEAEKALRNVWADPVEFDRNIKLAQNVMKEFVTSEEDISILEDGETPLGNNPELVKALATVGQLLRDARARYRANRKPPKKEEKKTGRILMSDD